MAPEVSHPRARIMGVNVSAITMADALRTVADWIDRKTCNYVCITGVHGVIESQSDPKLMAIHERAGMVTPDGMRGRVASINGIFIGSSNELGAFYAGSMARLLGLVPAVVLGGFVTLGVVGVTALKAPQLRRLDLRRL